MLENCVVFNTKPSHRIIARFKSHFPNVQFYGRATLGGKSNSYLLPIDVYEANKERLKEFGTRARNQPFLK